MNKPNQTKISCLAAITWLNLSGFCHKIILDENVFIVFLWKSLQNFTFFLAHRAMQVQYLVLFSRKCCLPHSIFCFSLYHPYNAIPALDAHFMRIWLWRWTVYATDSSTLQLHTRHRDACAKCAVLRIKDYRYKT